MDATPAPDTLPYRLAAAVCRVLVDEPCTRKTLLAPLEYEWVHPDDDDTTPVSTTALASLRRSLPDEEHSLAEWNDRITEIGAPRSVTRYLGWVASRRRESGPTPDAVRGTLTSLIAAYESCVLPRRHDRDDATLGDTARTARAVVRMRDLVTQVATKYRDRIEEGASRSWRNVDRITEAIGGYRAGRREHANARALDLMEANDTWGLSRPVGIIVGLRDGEWLQSQESALTDALAQAVMAGDGETAALAPQAPWSDAGVRDQFQDAVETATETLICTRHRLDSDGTAHLLSPLLTELQAAVEDGV